MVAFFAGMLDAIGVLGLVGLLDITGYLLKEGSNVRLHPFSVTGNKCCSFNVSWIPFAQGEIYQLVKFCNDVSFLVVRSLFFQKQSISDACGLPAL